MKRSKYYNTMIDTLDNCFPKGKCQERSRALLMIALIEMMLNGVEFENGEPTIKKSDLPPIENPNLHIQYLKE